MISPQTTPTLLVMHAMTWNVLSEAVLGATAVCGLQRLVGASRPPYCGTPFLTQATVAWRLYRHLLPCMQANIQPIPFATPTTCIAQGSVDAWLDAIGCVTKPTKPLLAWRFFLRLYLRYITEHAEKALLPGTGAVIALMDSITAREIPPALRKAKNSRQGLRDAKRYIRRHAEGVLGCSTCIVGDSTTGLGLGLFVHRQVQEGEVIAGGWAHYLTPADWSRLRSSRADFCIVSTKDRLAAIPSETHRAVWLTGAACFTNHLCRGANAAICTREISKGKIDYVVVATRDLQPFEEVFCNYGEEYFVGRDVGCRNACCLYNE